MSKQPPGSAIGVCLVDDDPLIREDLTLLLRRSDGLRLLNVYAHPHQALAGIPRDQPDVVLMDIHLPEITGIECVRRLKAACPRIQFLMLTVYEDADKIFQSLQAGATGYLLKRCSQPQLLQAIVDVAEGGSPFSSHIARKVVQFFHQQPPSLVGDSPQTRHLQNLSAREEEVLEALARGITYKEIAFDLHISIDTVRKHISSIYSKLHVHSRTEAVVKYLGKTL